MSLLKTKSALVLGIAGVGGLTATQTAFADEAKPASRTTDKVGHLDVSVDDQSLRDAISLAESQGVQVFRDETRVRTGNGDQTKKHIKEAEDYYKERANSLTAVTNKYKADLATYNQKVKENEALAQAANAEVDAYRTNLSAVGRNVTFTSKVYSDANKQSAVTTLKQAVKTGEQVRDTRAAIAEYESLQNSFVGFQTQADQGNIKVTRETVTVKNAEDLKKYRDEITASNQKLTEYVNSLSDTNGSIAEDKKPSFKLYNIVVDPALLAEYNKPVEAPNFEAAPVERVAVPQFTYAFYDIRQTSDASNDIENKDGEKITIKSTAKDGGNVHQAMVNQTIGIATTNDPLPAGRWDKYHVLTVSVNLPKENVELNEELTKSQNPNWTTEINKETGKITFRATDDYLVEINQNQRTRQGTIGGMMNDSFDYKVPNIFVKLLKDNTDYEFTSNVMINHEYKASSGSVHVRTDQADPQKHNKDDKGVVIDGKTVFFGSTNNYNITWDFDQYKGVNIDKEMQEKGLDLIDFYPSDALSFNPKKHKILVQDGGTTIAVGQEDGTFKDGNGKTVEGLTWSQVDRYDGIDRKGPAIKVSIKGYDHPYYKNYVEQGKSLNVVMPMATKIVDQTPGVIGGVYGGNTYTNVAYQSDFGNVYKSNEVTNTVTTMDPRKDAVLAVSQLESLDLKANPKASIEHKTFFQYRASGSKIALDVLGRAPETYSITDAFHNADQYDGVYFVESNGEIQFKPGTPLYAKYRKHGGKLPKDSDVTKYTTQTIVRDVSKRGTNTPTKATDNADSLVTIVKVDFDQDFLDQIDHTKSTFQMDVFFQAKRAKNVQNVNNVFQEEVNGLMFDSTETVTNTSENAVDALRKDVDGMNKSFGSALSVIRREVQKNADTIVENKRNQDTFNKSVAETLAQHHRQIDENSATILSVRRLAQNNAKRLDIIEPKLVQTDSELTIYVPTVRTDADALMYATNHGIAAGSIKEIKLNAANRYVVVYNTSKTAINGGPEALSRPEHVDKVAQFMKTIAIQNQPNRASADKVANAQGIDKDKVAAVDVDGSTYNYVVDTRDDVKPISPTPTTVNASAKTFTLDIPVAYSEGYKVKALEDARLKPYLLQAKYTTDTNYRLTMNLVGSMTKDELEKLVKSIIQERTPKA